MTTRAPHPKTVEGCEACLKSVSRVCIQHAGGQVPDEHDPRKCQGFNLAGSRCKKWAIKDEPFCLAHQTDETAKTAARAAPGQARSDRRKLAKAAEEHLAMLGRPTGIDLDALEELAALSDEAIQLKNFLRDEMKKKVKDVESEGQIDQALNRYVSALDRSAKLVEGYGKHGLEKRLVEVREELAALVTAVFNALLVFVPLESQPAAIVELNRTVAAIEQPKALTA